MMDRISRLTLLAGGIAALQLGAAPARAEQPSRPGTTTNRTETTGRDTTGNTRTDSTDRSAGSNQQGSSMNSDSRAMESADTDMSDADIVRKLHAINVHEIEMGRLAESNGTKDVKDYGRKLVSDHQDADKKLQDVAKKLGVDMTSAASEAPPMRAEELKTTTGRDFDRHFLITMIKAHDDAVLFITTQAFAHPAAKEVRDYAKKEMGKFDDHRKKAIDILEKEADKSPPRS